MTMLDTPKATVTGKRIIRLRDLAIRALTRMYRPESQTFVFRVRKTGDGIRLEGESLRYSAMTLIGLISESEEVVNRVLSGDRLEEVSNRLVQRGNTHEPANMGDIAVIYWAAREAGYLDLQSTLVLLRRLLMESRQHETVELAWVLTALCHETNSNQVVDTREEAYRQLLQAYDERSDLFAHWAGATGSYLRGHVDCFADLVYPIQALSRYHVVTGKPEPLRIANACAWRMCDLIGPAGQWWWHYDVRSGRVVEKYPVYSVHQDAMAPMALLDLVEAGGDDHSESIAKGLDWLESAPELAGGSLIDEQAGVIWRKVARREPWKLARRAQALASRVHAGLRCPAVDALFPAGIIDDECRPYHMGWLLHAWQERRIPN